MISILDDNIVEQNEVFQVILSTPEGGGSVGPQFRANVTIIDDDAEKLSPKLTQSLVSTTTSVAGSNFSISLSARNGVGESMSTGGEKFFAALENNLDSWSIDGRRQSSRKTCSVDDEGTGVYTVVCDGIAEQGGYQLRTWHAFPGSLRGEYYSDAFFQNLALVRQDHVVNFTWGFGPLIPTATDFVTIRWSGAIWANTTGWYSFLVNADDQARLWIDGDLLLDHFHERQVNLEPSRSVYLQGNRLYEIVLEYREINGAAFAQLMWKPPYGSSFKVIPQTNLYSLFEIDLSPVEVTVKSAATSPYTTECIGEGLFTATVLKPSYFSVCPRDEYGNLRNDADATFISTQIFSSNFTLQEDIYHGVGAEIINPVLTFNANTSCWDGYYIPLRAGEYELRILYQDSPDAAAIDVAGSPYYLHVEPDIAFGPLSDVTGLPLPLYAEAGNCYNFTVTLRDRYRNLLLRGGDHLDVYMFRVDYFNETAGEEPPAFLVPIGSPTFAPTQIPTMAPTTIYNSIYPLSSDSGGDLVRYGIVSDLGNGNYSIRVCPVIAGTYEIQVLLGGSGVSNQPNRIMDPVMSYMTPSGRGTYLGQYVAHAPYAMYVEHTRPSVITSTVAGLGLLNATVGIESFIVLTVRDPYDNVVRASPYKPTVTFAIDESPDAFVTVWDYKNGSYLLGYIPKKAGNNSLSVYVNGHRIRYSPFVVPVADGGSSGKYSYADGNGLREGITGQTSYFTVFSYDLSGNRKADYNDVYKFVVESPENITGYLLPCPYPPELTHPICDPLESDGGYYYGSFVPRFTGSAKIRVYLVMNETKSMEVSNSPFVALISPSAPYAEGSDVTGTLRSIEAGTVGTVNIQLRDYYDNQLNAGGLSLELALHGVACDWGTVAPYNATQAWKNQYNYKGFFYGYPIFYGEVLDKQDGSYQITYQVNRTGQYVLRLSLAEQGLNATYFNDTTLGYLYNSDDTSGSFVDNLRGSPDAHGTSISWTGDIGGPTSAHGDLGQSSYVHRYMSRREANLNMNASRGIKAYLDATGGSDWNSTHRYNMREHFWSARWVGMLTPPTAEMYKFMVHHDAHSTVRVWVGGHGMGLNDSSKGSLLCDTTQVQAEQKIGYYNFTDTRYREIVVEFVHTTGDAQLSLSWESLSTPRAIIPASAFTHWRNISHHNVTIHPTTLCSRCSTAWGPSLHTARVAEDQSILVYGRDVYGNLLQRGGDAPSMVAIGAHGVAFRGKVVDYGNSTYRIYYYPTQAGTYRLYVTIGCCVGNVATGLPGELQQRLPLLVQGAPFLLHVAPAVVNSSRSITTGKGMVGGTVEEDLSFTVQYRDVFNNPTTVENVQSVRCVVTFVDAVTGLALTPVRLSIVPHVQNVTVHYAFHRAGRYRMSVTLGYVTAQGVVTVTPAPILGSPYEIVLNPQVAFTNHSVARGVGLRQGTAQETATFEIQLYDVYGNKLLVGGDKFWLRLEGDSNFTQAQRVYDVVPRCHDTQNGRYQCSYSAYHPGPHQLRMKLLSRRSGDTDQQGTHPGGNGLRVAYYNNVQGANWASSLSQSTLMLERIETTTVTIEAANGFMIPSEALSGVDSPFVGEEGNALYQSQILSLVRMGQSIRWTGYVVAPRTDTYRIAFDNVQNLNVTIYVDQRVVFDQAQAISHPVSLVQHAAYAIRIEASTNVVQGETLSGRLVWSTATVRPHPIASFFLYTDAEEFPLSPYPVTVHDREG